MASTDETNNFLNELYDFEEANSPLVDKDAKKTKTKKGKKQTGKTNDTINT